jgi:glycosyltransferase involved in cell wall biosynthesis
MLGPLARYTGYAVGFRGLVRKLLSRGGLDIDLRPVMSLVPEETEPELKALLDSGKNYDLLGIAFGSANLMESLNAHYRIIYSMYETNDIPFLWQSAVERANEVWVPNMFNAEVFGKYNHKIRIVPWGIDNTVFRPLKRERHDGYVFGALGVQSPRKGTDILVSAFKRAFNGNPDVKLVIKTRDTKEMPPINNPMVEVIDEDWPEERVVRWLNDIDCIVQCSRGEGSGCPPLQAAFCGTPSLVTNWGGMTDYIDGCGIFPVQYLGLVRAKNMDVSNGYWAEPDMRHLSDLMEWAVETKPQVTGDYSRWTLDSMADHFLQYIQVSWRLANGR